MCACIYVPILRAVQEMNAKLVPVQRLQSLLDRYRQNRLSVPLVVVGALSVTSFSFFYMDFIKEQWFAQYCE